MDIIREEFNGIRLYEGRYPSVTTITDFATEKFILQWQESVGEEIAAYARDRGGAFGTAIHVIAERIAATHGTGDTVGITNPEHLVAASAVRAFYDAWVDEILAVEKSFVSHKHGFGGTIDLIAKIKPEKGGGTAIVDLKTSKKLRPEYDLQVGGYSVLAKENGYPIDRRLIVWLKKFASAPGKNPHVKEPKTALEFDEAGFLGLLDFYRWAKRNTLPDIGDLPK